MGGKIILGNNMAHNLGTFFGLACYHNQVDKFVSKERMNCLVKAKVETN